MAKIIAAHDISGIGRCSLTAALAVLPAFGHTCHPLPTAVLSQQTGFGGYTYLDMTEHMPAYLAAWNGLELKPDMIYTGFLGGGRQAHMLADFIEKYENALIVIDPVMGDNAQVYGCFGEDFVRDMRGLCARANILLPNMTEFNLLCKKPLAQALPQSEAEILTLAGGIEAPRLKYIVITSATGAEGSCNVLVDLEGGRVNVLPCENNGVSYSGAGDLFASVLCALTANGRGIDEAVRLAADFISAAVKNTPQDADTRYGINYEPLLAKFAAGI